MTSRERANEWKRSWSQQEDPHSTDYTAWCYDVVSKLNFAQLKNSYIFNCSDGPAALGILMALLHKAKSLNITLTDIHEYAVEAAEKHIQAGLRATGRASSVAVRTQIWDTRHLLVHQQSSPVNYIAFEPIGVDMELFESAYQQLSPDSSICVIGRGVMGPVSYLGIAGKHVDGDVTIVSGIETQSGVVTAIKLTK